MNSICKVDKKQQKQPNKILCFFEKTQKLIFSAFATLCSALMFAMPACADVTVNDKLNTKTMIGGIIGFVIEVAKWMGLVVVAAGIFMFVFAYKDDNAESQSRAARFAVVGALLIGLESILELTGLISSK